MSQLHTQHPEKDLIEEDLNIVELWTTPDLPRIIAGLLAGAFAGLTMAVFAGGFATFFGYEFLFPWKLAGTILLGSAATEHGVGGAGIAAVIAGAALIEIVGGFLGAVFGHFVKTNCKGALAAMGVVWALFSWIFIWNLFLQSFASIRWSQISPGATIPIVFVFGLSLVSVAGFDRIVRGK